MEEKEEEKTEYLNFFNTNEINRLHRAAKNKDKKEIIKWGQNYDQFLNRKYLEKYKNYYLIWLEETFADLDLAIAYTLHFSEATKFGKKRLKSFADDIYATMKSFYTKDFTREDCKKSLQKDGINILSDEERLEK